MTGRRVVIALLALAGALIAHTVGYGVAHTAHADGHGYVAHALALLAPIAAVSGAAAAVAEVRRLGPALRLSVPQLLGAQVVLYMLQEVGERLVHGHLGPLVAAPVVLGLLAQVPVALLLVGLVHLARRVATLLFASARARPTAPPGATVVPATVERSRPVWSPLSSRAPPLPA